MPPKKLDDKDPATWPALKKAKPAAKAPTLFNDPEWAESFAYVKSLSWPIEKQVFFLDSLIDVASDQKSTAEERKLAGAAYEAAATFASSFHALRNAIAKRDKRRKKPYTAGAYRPSKPKGQRS